MKDKFLGFKARAEDRRKVEALAQQTGLSMSEVLRSLVENAEVKQVTIAKPVSTLYQESRA